MRSPPFTYSMTKYRRSCDHRDEGNRREESGIDGEYAISLFCAKKLKKVHKISMFLHADSDLSREDTNSVLHPALTLLSESFHRSCYTFHDKVT